VDCIEIGPFDDRAEWLEARRHGIGGSDIATLLGLSTYTSPLEVYRSKTEDVEEGEIPEMMRWGMTLEPVVAGEWARQHDAVVDTSDVILQSREHPILRHSPDGLVYEGDEIVAGLEIKCVRSDSAWDPLPPFYEAQVQHGLLVTGLPRWHVVALVGGQKMIERVVEPDAGIHAQIVTVAERFWRENVLLGIPPKPDGSDSSGRVLREEWVSDPSSSAQIDPNVWDEYLHFCELLKSTETGKATLEQTIQQRMGSAEQAVVDGAVVATWKTGTRTAIDTKRLRVEAPEIAEKFSKTTTTRTFRRS
jgi:putative phage-type endonuclease